MTDTTPTPDETPAAPAKAPTPKPTNSVSPPEPYAVVGKGDTDEVRLSAIKYKNQFARKSLSVLHVQRRLTEKGFDLANADPKGYFGESTQAALHAYQDKQGLEKTDVPDAATLTVLFDGDPNVTLALY